MAAVFTNINEFLERYADERTTNWPLLTSPMPLLIIVTTYLYFVLKIGPDYMRERKPYNLKLPITLYNIGQIVSCTVIIYELMVSGWWNDYSYGCQLVDTSRSPKAMRMARLTWWVMILKLSEFIETVFFVLRKKQNQVTKLHLYHHVSTLTIAYMCSKYTPGGMATFPIIINCIIHIVMYAYYLASIHANKALQEKLNKWKRYLTMVQMIQFCVILGHAFQGFLPGCPFNKAIPAIFVPNVFLVFYLFYDFYRRSYKTKKIQ